MGDGGGFGAAGGAELAEDVGHVHAGRLRRDEQHGGDLPVAAARGDEPEDLAFPAGQRGQDLAVAMLFRGSDPGPAGEVVERPAQRPGPELVRRLRRLAPLVRGLVPAPRLGERLGQPPAGPGNLVDIIRAELVEDRLPGLRVVVAAGPAVLRLGPGEPAASFGAEDELGPLAERGALAGDLQQLGGRGEFGGRGLVVTGGAGVDRPVGPGAQGDRGRPDGGRVVTPGRLVDKVDRELSLVGWPARCRPARGHARRAARAP